MRMSCNLPHQGELMQTQLLIENADLREQVRDCSTTERTDGDDSWGAWPWKSDFQRHADGRNSTSSTRKAGSAKGAARGKQAGAPSGSADVRQGTRER